jgi:hypothetical protein
LTDKKEILEIILSRYVVFVGGRYSRGKSLILTFLTLMDILLNNRKNIYSNMPLNFEQSGFNTIIRPFIDTAFFDKIPLNANIIWDETPNDINARNFNTTKNKYLSVISVDIAKNNDRLRGTFQFGDTLEKVMGMLCELIFIPEYINKYSDNTKEDNIKRIDNKDFLMHWIIIDKRDNDKRYELTLNLYPIIFLYNTRFKPIQLWINHDDYIQKMKSKDLQIFEIKNPVEIKKRLDNWDDGLREIGKVMIR